MPSFLSHGQADAQCNEPQIRIRKRVRPVLVETTGATAAPSERLQDLALHVETVPVSAISGQRKNARHRSARQIDQLAASIREFGFVNLRYLAGSIDDRRRAIACGDRMPQLPDPRNNRRLSDIEEADPAGWLIAPDRDALWVQTPHQQNGHAMTLVILDEQPDEDDDGVEDAYDRFGPFEELSLFCVSKFLIGRSPFPDTVISIPCYLPQGICRQPFEK